MNIGSHLLWITSRAAGGAALLLASASVTAGLMMSARRKSANKRDVRAIHEALSLTTLAMVVLHGVSLLGDSFFHPGLTGIAIPFAGTYRPVWTGLGIVSGYGLAALGLTYYAPRPDRRRPLAQAPPADRGLLGAGDRPHDRGRQRCLGVVVPRRRRRPRHPRGPAADAALARAPLRPGGRGAGAAAGRALAA